MCEYNQYRKLYKTHSSAQDELIRIPVFLIDNIGYFIL